MIGRDSHDPFADWPDERAHNPVHRDDHDDSPEGGIDDAINSLRTPPLSMPDLTASILSAVDERREFLCDKTRWWVKAFRVAACAAIAGGALTAVLAWRYAPETTTLVETPPTPSMILLSAADNTVCEGPSALRNGLDTVSAVEPARLLTIVVNPENPDDPSRICISLGIAEPLPCACRGKMSKSAAVGLRPHAASMISWQPLAAQTQRAAVPVDVQHLRAPMVRFASVNRFRVDIASPSGAASPQAAWEWIALNRFANIETVYVVPEVFVDPARLQAEAAAVRLKTRPSRPTLDCPLADGVGNLLGGSGGWIGQAPTATDSGTESGARR